MATKTITGATRRYFSYERLVANIIRELRNIGSRSSEEVADMLDIYLAAGGSDEAAAQAALAAFANACTANRGWHASETHCEDLAWKSIEWHDTYGAAAGVHFRQDTGDKLQMVATFKTVSGHGADIGITVDENGDIVVDTTTDVLESERFWPGYASGDVSTGDEIQKAREEYLLSRILLNDNEAAAADASAEPLPSRPPRDRR